MKRLVAILVVALATAGAALAVNPTETVPLKAAGSPVRGTVTAGAAGKGTRVVFKLRGLPANAAVRAVFQAGTCARPSASFAAAGSALADAKGVASWTGTIRFHGTPVSWKTAADGGHLIAVVVGGKVVACGVIPGMS
jgi:Cu/Zn superoxide dismutase